MDQVKLARLALYTKALVGAGGAERLLWEEEKYFSRHGVETAVFTFKLDPAALYDYHPRQVRTMKNRFKLTKLLALRKALLEFSPQIVIGQSAKDTLYLFFATLFTPIKYIAHIHGTFFWFPEDKLKYALIHRRVFSRIRNSLRGHREFIPAELKCGWLAWLSNEVAAAINYLTVRQAGARIVLTGRLKWEAETIYGKPADIARGFLPAQALAPYQPKIDVKKKLGLEGKRIIFNVGRLDRRKRIATLIQAFTLLATRQDDLYLVIGGGGEEKGNLLRLANSLPVAEKIKFTGFIADGELFDYYAACDLFVFPSWTSAGISPYEALSQGKKVVLTNEADQPFNNDAHVFLAEPTPEDLAVKMALALDSKVTGVFDLSAYTWDNYFATVFCICERVLQS
ncbi:MAG: glycosyltransferase family 4 protein [bacterium]|nr:glycosyltransferase family 4 protein [bacterium]MDD5354421.1 glycosyltransferase family 4 protein [bacterium]MDD5755709.1 glycosyltransferase family 4 protein [bacterium]